MDSTIALLADLVVIIGALLAAGTVMFSGVRNVWSRLSPIVERFGINALMVLIVVVSLAINANVLLVTSSIEGRLGTVENRLATVENRIGTVEGRIGSVEDRIGTIENRIRRIELLVNPVD